jgi:Na+/H+ antiporter NhaD/arsenite permease-like protein
MDWGVIIFAVTYVGVALGGIPGMALDRTGVALLGAIAMVVARVLSTGEAIASIDAPTILLLYGLMVISAQLHLSGFYGWTARRITQLMCRPRFLLLALMGVAAGLAALLTNDIICLAFTPVICAALLPAGMDPMPHLIGVAVAANIGSAATLVGNPQNMLLGQMGRLSFSRYSAWALAPTLLSLLAAYGLLLLICRRRLGAPLVPGAAPRERRRSEETLDRRQAIKGAVVMLAAMGFFLTPLPRELTAMALAGVLLMSRHMRTRALLGLVDWHLLTLFAGLFVVVRGIETVGLPANMLEVLAGRGFNLHSPGNLIAVSSILSNLVSNVPATMLLIKFLPAGQPVSWYVTAVAATFAGNLITIGSIANLIVIERAREYGVSITFRDHARAGIPITLASLLILWFWTWISPALF